MSSSQCFENPPNVSQTCGAGTVEEFAGLKTYLAGSPDSKLAILLISDVFGYEAPNLRKLADKVAASGFFVVVPDFFYGDPVDLNNPQFDRETWRKVHNACFENPPNVSQTCGAGTVEEFAGLKTYLAGSPDSKLAILLISDVFGYEAPNLRKLADKVAASGFFVVVPDFFYGDPVDLNNPQFDRETWRKVHSADKGYEDAKLVIAALKNKGVSSIGAAGFCWGGKVVVKLACSNDINAGVVLHPGQLTIDDIKGVKVPISFLGAEFDHASPPEQLKEFGELLSAKSEVDSFVKIFPGVSHGWSVRYNVEDESAVKSAEEAHCDMLNWFTKYVK